MRCLFIPLIAWLCLILTGCSSTNKITRYSNIGTNARLVYRDKYELPYAMNFKNSVVGGLSGIDYDREHDQYFLISDDPAAHGPSRYYTAKIGLSNKGIDSVVLTEMTPLLNTEGLAYSDVRKDRAHSLDAEAMRYIPSLREIVYSSEGQRLEDKDKKWTIQNPTIYIARLDGTFKDSFELPQNMYMHQTEYGPRHNSVFEGLTLSNDQRSMFVSVEEPLYQDGPRVATGDSTALIRFLKFDMHSRKQVAQYAYRIEAVPYPPTPSNAFKINGVSDILYAGHDKFLVIERAFMTGRKSTSIRIYLADAGDANDISSVPALTSFQDIKSISKKLLFNLEDLHIYIDNIEGVTFGPQLPNGHQSLLLVSDDNFSSAQTSQFFLFEFIP